jgi:hypothetical protein
MPLPKTTKTKWLYGNAWERFPIEDGEVWSAPGGSYLAVGDIRWKLMDFMIGADMVYTDPPWNQSNVNGFLTKAGLTTKVYNYAEFYTAYFRAVRQINPRVCYTEIGKEYVETFRAEMAAQFRAVQTWPILYYKKNPAFLVRGSDRKIDADYSGIDDELLPRLAVGMELPWSVADLCTGRGGTAIAAHLHDVPFRGMEVNKRRLACTIERAHEIGVDYMRVRS